MYNVVQPMHYGTYDSWTTTCERGNRYNDGEAHFVRFFFSHLRMWGMVSSVEIENRSY